MSKHMMCPECQEVQKVEKEKRWIYCDTCETHHKLVRWEKVEEKELQHA